MICKKLKDLYYVGQFAIGSMICTGVKDLQQRIVGYPPPFFGRLKIITLIFFTYGINFLLKMQQYNTGHNILGFYYVLGNVQDLPSSITDFL